MPTPHPNSIQVQAPATSANLGPGFDALGLALDLHNTFRIAPAEAFALSATGHGAHLLPTDPAEHLTVRAYQAARAELGLEPATGLEVQVEIAVPPSRGLGSSATASVAGILAAEAHAGQPLDPDARLALATRLEGHPDNVAPCLLGGLCVAVGTEAGPRALRLELPAPPALIVSIPQDVELSTAEMRAALPAEVPFGDAVFGVGRAALLIGALTAGRPELLPAALDDRLHQPYRGPKIPGFARARAAAREAGAYGLVISGSGPTLLALAPATATEAVLASLREAAEATGEPARVEQLALAQSGAAALSAGEGRGDTA